VNVPSSIEPHTEAQFRLAFDGPRNQWNSPRLLDWFSEKLKRNINTKILVILDVDAYLNGLNYVLGKAFPKRGLGVVYLPRIKEEFYGLKPNDELFYERMVKECIHELGHVFGFCSLLQYAMCNSLNDTDVKARGFCDRCRMKKANILTSN
jgi:archaemetzincin